MSSSTSGGSGILVTQNSRGKLKKKLKTQGKNSKLKEKTQNSRKKLKTQGKNSKLKGRTQFFGIFICWR